MNKQTVAKAAAAIVVLMILFPPWAYKDQRLGYSPLWEPKLYPPAEVQAQYNRIPANMDTPLLLGQIVVALGAAGLAMFAFRKD